jgi:hypothetical protein
MGWQLIRGKGTRGVLKQLVNLLLDGETAYIVENANSAGLARGQVGGQEPYGFTVLVNHSADEQLACRLKHLIGQFKPLRCKVDIMFISDQNTFDSYVSLDVNAALSMPGIGRLDTRVTLNGMTCLE